MQNQEELDEERRRKRIMLGYDRLTAKMKGTPLLEMPQAEPGDAGYVSPIRSSISDKLDDPWLPDSPKSKKRRTLLEYRP